MNPVITSFISRSQNVIDKTRKDFGSLDAGTLNKKPAPGKWSVAQVFDHLITYNSTYFPIYEEVASGRYKKSFWQKINPLSKLTGSFLLKVLRSDTKKVKALKSFEPSGSPLPASVIDDFIQNTKYTHRLF